MKKCILGLIKKCIALIGIVAIGLGLFANTSYAESTGSITIYYNCAGKDLVNVVAHAYMIATVNDGRYELVDAFSGAGITDDDMNILSVDDFDDEEKIENAQKVYAEYAKTFYEYALLNGISDDALAISGSDGVATFSDLSIGVYIIYTEPLRVGTFTYVTAPLMVAIPSWDAVNGVYKLDCVVTAKCEEIEDDIDYTLRKVWNDSGYESNRPGSITAKIYCDGAEYATVTLSSENNWSYSWSYAAGHTFSVTEVSTASGYTASVSQNAYTFTITNTYTPPETPETPTTPDTPTTPEEPTTPVEEVLGVIRKIPDVPAVLGARRLPQTGLLWWPIPFLLIGGFALMFYGIKSMKKSK
ncbi:MAG: Cna B-type domain-containing protein [Butyrivibrio sp.]|nr:Cna B-type domain-containing protein [Butyrivibrio sp.]